MFFVNNIFDERRMQKSKLRCRFCNLCTFMSLSLNKKKNRLTGEHSDMERSERKQKAFFNHFELLFND